MSVNNEDIYSEAIGLFNDPLLTSAFNMSPIQFFQIMYTYLQNAIPRFNNPSTIQNTLALVTNPTGQTESFIGNGGTTFTLSSTPLSNSYFQTTINNVVYSTTFNYSSNQAISSTPIPLGQIGYIQWYYAGKFTDPQNLLDATAQNIIARLIVVCWSEKEKNFLLDIRRLLGDTDFKLISEANSLRAKSDWYNTMREEVDKKMNQYSWALRFKNWTQTGHF